MKLTDIYPANFVYRYEPLKDKEFIGGWVEGEDVNLWYREKTVRKVVKVEKVPRYFCVTKTDFQKLSPGQLQEWKNIGLFKAGKIIGDYAYFYLTGDTYQNTLDDWYTLLDNLGVKPLEGDVKRQNRLMIDMGWRVASMSSPNPPRLAFYDIETDDRNNKISAGEDRILSIAWKEFDTGQEYFDILEADTDEAEREFLIRVLTRLVKYDILIGYNNYGFDDICLEGKFKYHKISQDAWRRVEKLDFFNLLERQGTFRQYGVANRKLDTIGQAVVGRGKIPHKEKIYELWHNNRALLREYNLEDVRLIHDMERKLSSASLVISLCSLSGLLHSLNYSPAKVVDNFLLRRAADRRLSGDDYRYFTGYYRPEHKLGGGKASPFSRNALAADRRKGREEELAEMGIEYEPVEGALVLESEPGLYTDVSAFDFNSLYPSTIIAFNIGADTLCDENSPLPKNKAPNGAYYRTDFVSNMASGVEFLLNERKRLKKLLKEETDSVRREALDVMQRAVKETANSFYGVTAQWGSRHYSKQIAESITSTGRYFLHFAEKHFALHNAKVVLGDTDSVYISLPADATESPVAYKEQYENALRASLSAEFGCYRPETFRMAFEKHATRVFLNGKKNYAMHLDLKDDKPVNEIIYKGLQIIKGNMCKFASGILKQLVDDIIQHNYGPDHFERMLERAKNDIVTGSVDYTRLLISARLGKLLDEYEGENPLVHVRIARRMAQNGYLVPEYTTISYLVTKGETPMEGVSEEEFLNDPCPIDGAWYFNTAILQVAVNYLSVVFPDIPWWEKFAFPKNLKRKPFSLRVMPQKVLTVN